MLKQSFDQPDINMQPPFAEDLKYRLTAGILFYKTVRTMSLLWPSQPNGIMSSKVSLPNHVHVYWAGLVLFTGQD